MAQYKFIILFLISILSLTALSPFKDKHPLSKASNFNNIDSLIAHVKSSGWDKTSFNEYSHWLVNRGLSGKEKEDISALPESVEKSFLNAIILKKAGDYEQMFETLFQSLKYSPHYLKYYDELVFAANAGGQLSFLEAETEKSNLPELYNFYLSALISSARGEYKQASELFIQASEQDTSDFNILYNISYMYRNIGDYKKSFDILKKAVSKSGNDKVFLTRAMVAEGTLNYLSDNFNQAKLFYEKALLQVERNNDKLNKITILINLGILSDHDGNTETARNLISQGLKIARDIDDYESEAFALSELGVSYTYTNDIIEARKNYRQSYSIYEKINDRLRLSLLSENIGRLYVYQFNYESALEYYEKGLEYAGENKYARALNLTGLADVYSNLSNYSKAIRYYREAQELSGQIKDLSLTGEVYNGIGTLYFNLNRYANAVKYFSDARQIGLKSGNVYTAADLNYKLGLAYLMSDSISAARHFLTAAIESAVKSSDFFTEALSYASLAGMEIDQKNLSVADLNINKALAIANQNNLIYVSAHCRLIKGEIYQLQNNFNEAMNSFSKGLEEAEAVNEFNLRIEAYKNLAELCRKNNLNEAAHSYYLSAIDLVENVSRPLFEEEDVQISYFSGKSDIYNSLADFYLQQDKYEEAFEIIDKARSRSTVQNLANLKLKSILKNQEIIDKLYDYQWIVNSGIYDKSKSDSVKILLNLLQKTITEKYPEAKPYIEQRYSSSLHDIQNALGKNENLVSIYSNDFGTHLFLVQKNRFEHFSVNTTRDQIKKNLAEISPYYASKTNDNSFFNQDLFSFNSKASNKLYKNLFQKVFSKIPEHDKIILAPSAELLTIPAEMLVVNINDNDSPYKYSDKDFLINHYSISYTPSASAFVHQKNNMLRNEDKAVVVGDPAINTSASGFAERRSLLDEVTSPGIPRNVALLPLKYSAEEVNEVGEIISADRIFINSRATETNFKQNAVLSRIIHLSTHSFLFNKQPVIFFSNVYDAENDGFLEAGEIVQLKLNSDLVVLSSCNSGLGVIDNAEGILGMTKAFYEAGAKSIIVSLWEVNDKYTSKFMSLFYKKLSEGYDKSEALRLAKLEFIKKYSANPYYWASFVLSGNINSLPVKSSLSAVPYLSGLALVICISILVIYIKHRRRI